MRGGWLVALALLGCGKSSDGTGGPTVDSGTTPGTPTVGTPSTGTGTGAATGTGTGATSGWEPTRYAAIYGWFGVRGGQIATVDDTDLFGTPIPQYTTLAIRLADDSIDAGSTPTNHCDVVYTVDATFDPATWTAATEAWYAVEIPAGANLTDANCRDLDLSAIWADPAAIIGAHRWGMGVAAVDAADQTALLGTTGTTAPAVLDQLLGAGWWTDAAAGSVDGGTWVEPGVAFAQAIDGTGLIVRDANHDPQNLLSADVPGPNGVVDAWYGVTPLGAWRPVSELLGP